MSQLMRYSRTCAQCSFIVQMLAPKILKLVYVAPESLQNFYGRRYEISISQIPIDYFPFYVDFFLSLFIDSTFTERIELDYE
jgi:hypothetical protein